MKLIVLLKLICDVIYAIYGLFHQVRCKMHTSGTGHF